MPSTIRRRSLALLLTPLLLLGLGSWTPAGADGTGLSATGPATTLPVQVGPAQADPDDDDPEPVYVHYSSASAAHGITVTASGDGLRVDYSHVDDTSLAAGGHGEAEVDVVATTPGFHTLTVTVSSNDAGSTDITFPRIWSAGGPFLTGGDSLAGEVFAWQGYASTYSDCEGCSYLEQHRVRFVDDHRALLGDLSDRTSTCGHCVPYAYDATTGLVQVGRDVIGQLTPAGLHTDGLVEADPQDFDEFYASATLVRYVHLPRGLRPRGTFTFHDRTTDDADLGAGLASVRLVLQRGTYALRYAVHGRHGGTVTQRGRCAVRRGELVLHPRRGHVLAVSTQVAADPTGRPTTPTRLVVQLPVHLRGPGRAYEQGVSLTTRR